METTAMEKVEQAPDDLYKMAIARHEQLLKGVSKDYGMIFTKQTDEFIRQRLKESKALCEDLLQEGKSYTTCGMIVVDKAQKLAAKGRCVAVWHDEVWEWIEDYIHRDEAKAAEEEKKKAEKPKTTAPKIKPAEKFDAKKAAEKAVAKSEEKKAEDNLSESKDYLQENKVTPISAGRKAVQKPKPEEPKKKKGEAEGQMSLFDFFG